MKIITISSIILFAFVLASCSNVKTDQGANVLNPKINNMKTFISIVEIPVTDFSRAVNFYQALLTVTIEVVDMDGTQMGVVSSVDDAVSVALIKGSDYKPSKEGTVVYLNAGDDLQPMLDNAQKNGGQLVVAKTAIGSDMGYFALFIDTEGNKVGLHSSN